MKSKKRVLRERNILAPSHPTKAAWRLKNRAEKRQITNLTVFDTSTPFIPNSAGAAEQLKSGALLVNPYDVEQMADTILQAFRMNEAERSARMKRMRRIVRNENVFWWVNSFLKAGAKLSRRPERVGRHKRVSVAR